MNTLFLLLGIVVVPICNLDIIENLNNSEYFVFSFFGLLIFSYSQKLLKKQNVINNNLIYSIVFLIGALIIYDLFCLVFFKANFLTYILQICIVLIYCLYEKWKRKH